MSSDLSIHERAARRDDGDPFLITADRKVTYGELRRDVSRIAGLLDDRGVPSDARIVVVSRDPVAVASLAIGVLASGRTLASLDPGSTSRELGDAAGRLSPAMSFVDRSVLDEVGWPANTVVIPIDPPAVRTVASRLLGRRKEVPAATDSYPGILGGTLDASTAPSIDPESIGLIVFTSGSSAQPKAVMLSRRALHTHLETLRRELNFDDAVIHNVLPLHHADGLIQGPIQAYINGGVWVRPSEFSLGEMSVILDAVYTHRVTHMIAVPTILALMDRVGSEFHDAFRTDEFRLIMSNAAPLGDRLKERIESQFDVVVRNSYGLSETVTSTLIDGRPIDCTVSIENDGVEVLNGGEGEIVIQGPHLFSGYLDDPSATTAVFDGTRFRTGD